MSKRRSLQLMAWLFFQTVQPAVVATAAECLDYSQYRHWSGSFSTEVSTFRFDVSGGIAAIRTGGNTITLWDISGNQGGMITPVAAGGYTPPFPAVDVRLAGQYAFITGTSAFYVLPIGTSTPVATLFTSSNILDVDGNIAAVVGGGVLKVIDITDPTAPVLRGSVSIPSTSVLDIELVGSMAYLATNDGLRIANVSIPESPVLVGFLGATSSSNAVTVQGMTAYIAAGPPNGAGALRVVDVSNPAAPSPIATVVTSAGPTDVAVSGSHLFTAGPNEEVEVWDVSNPSSPTLIDNYNVASPRYLVIDDGLLYGTFKDGSFHVINWSAPEVPAPPPGAMTGTLTDVITSGNRAYGCTSSDFVVLDLDDPALPAIEAMMNLAGGKALEVFEALAGVARGNLGVTFVDVTNPAAPLPRGTIVLAEPAEDLVITSSHAYVAAGAAGLVVLDVSAPDDPEILNEILTSYPATSVSLVGGYLYVCETIDEFISTLEVYDLANPASPGFVRDAGVLDARAVVVNGNQALVTGQVLTRLDVSDPSDPQITAATFSQVVTRKAVIVDNVAYVTAASSEGMYVMDLSIPGAFGLVGSHHRFGQSLGAIATSQGYVYVGDEVAGQLRVLPTQCGVSGVSDHSQQAERPSTILLGSPSPNPSRSVVEFSIRIDPDEAVSAQVLDVAGRIQRRLDEKMFPNGTGRLSWNGRLDNGSMAPAGLYFMRVRTKSGWGSARLLRVP